MCGFAIGSFVGNGLAGLTFYHSLTRGLIQGVIAATLIIIVFPIFVKET